MTGNPFSADNLARRSFEMLCEGALIDIESLIVHVPDIPGDLAVGQEIDVLIMADVVDTSSGVGAHESSEKLTLPLMMTGRSPQTGELFFRVPQRVIQWRFVGEDFSICFSTPDINGARVWFSGDCLVRMDWTEYSEIEKTKRVVPMFFADATQTAAVHPELSQAA